MHRILIVPAIACLCLAGCATAPGAPDLLPMRLIGPDESWSGELSRQGVTVTSPHGPFSIGEPQMMHLSASASLILMNAEASATDYVSVLLQQEPCTVNGRDYAYSAYFGARRVAEGDYVLRGCAEPAPHPRRR